MENDYTYDDGFSTDGILINKSLNINGNGHIIDASNQSRIFYIASNNVILTDITFKNGNADYGGAIYTETSNVTISSSQFIQNSARSGGAIYTNDTDEITIMDSAFIQNNVLYGAGQFSFKILLYNQLAIRLNKIVLKIKVEDHMVLQFP